MKSWCKRGLSEAGSVFTVLLAGVALAATLSLVVYQQLTGPVATVVRVTQKSMADTQMLSVSKIMIMDAANQTGAGDCDADGMIEPRAYRATTGQKPTNGGLVPLTIGAPTTDPWKSDYGYCVWDVGAVSGAAGCGGATGRLDGSDNPAAGSAVTQTVMAIISAGPDRQFQTTCNAYVNGTTDLITTSGDDVVLRYTYAEAASATSSLWTLKSGTPTTAVINKDLEVGSGGTGNIIASGGIKPGTEATVTACSAGVNEGMIRYNTTTPGLETCTGAAGWKASGGGSSKTFNAGNTANCADDLAPADGTPDHLGEVRYNSTTQAPEYCNGIQWLPFTINTPGVNLVITPASANAMNVDGASNADTSTCSVASGMTCGAEQSFTVANQGNTTSSTVSIRARQTIAGVTSTYLAATLASATNGSNFVITSNTCTTTLAPNASCTVKFRPKANGNTTYSADLLVIANNNPIGIMQGTATNFGCVAGRAGGGGYYAACSQSDGDGSYDLVVSPSGCSGATVNPTCSGNDYLTLRWGDYVDLTGLPYCWAGTSGPDCVNAKPAVNLINFKSLLGATFTAAEYCDALVLNGYTDWYLPNEAEMMQKIYPVKSSGALTGYQNNGYWTSTLWGWDQINHATSIWMADGSRESGSPQSRSYNRYIRCVRRDNLPLPSATVDNDPDTLNLIPAVSFTSGTRTTSTSMTVKGITTPVAVSISGSSGSPAIKINGGGEVSSGSINLGQTLQVVMDAPSVMGTKNTATLNIGPDSYTWWVGYADQAKVAKAFIAYTPNGGVGGLSGADALCNSTAGTSTMGLSGDWKAIMSSSSINALDRVPWSWGTLKTVTGATIVDGGFTDLFDGSLDAPMGFNQNGVSISSTVWTGSSAYGRSYSPSGTSSTYFCYDWTNGSNYGGGNVYGASSSTDGAWLNQGNSYCGSDGGYPKYIYCIENVDGSLDTIPADIIMPYYVQVPTSSRQTSPAVTIGGMSAGASATLSVAATGGSPTFKINGGAEVTSGTVQNGDTVLFLITAPATASTSYKMTITVNGSTVVGYWRVWTGDNGANLTKRVFVTSATYGGSPGGVTGFDSYCQSAASGAGLGGTWKAIASGITEPEWAINRIGYNWSTLKLVDNTTVVAYAGGFWSTSPSLVSPIIKDQSGGTQANVASWTNTKGTGLPYVTTSDSNNCNNWTNTWGQGHTGNSSATAEAWVNWGVNPVGSYYCVQDRIHLYCIEQ